MDGSRLASTPMEPVTPPSSQPISRHPAAAVSSLASSSSYSSSSILARPSASGLSAIPSVRALQSTSSASSSSLLGIMSPQFKKQLDSVRIHTTPKKERAKSKKNHNNIPMLPEWTKSRMYLTGDFLSTGEKSRPAVGPALQKLQSQQAQIASLPQPVQELIMMEELLSAMLGFEGKHIKCQTVPSKEPQPQLASSSPKPDFKFFIDGAVDASLSEMVTRLLPLCTQYVKINRFLDSRMAYEYGQVVHAFCAATRTLLKEYVVLVAQLEHQFRQRKLSLQKMWFYAQPALRTMEVLDRIITEAQRNGGYTGGTLLNLVYERTATMGGDRQTKDLIMFLLEKSCIPYLEMLESWIYQGAVKDPFNEFMISEKEELTKENLAKDFNDTYWESRYTLRAESQVPIFLKNVADRALITGKYLNVIRESGKDIQNPCAERILFTMNEREYIEKIEKAYGFASKRLLDLLLTEHKLLERLRSIKHYFLLDQGDFFVQFMDIADEELAKPTGEIAFGKIESLLDLALRTSASSSDPYKDEITCIFSPYDLAKQMSKIQSVSGLSISSSSSFSSSSSHHNISSASASASSSFASSVSPTELKGHDTFTLDYIVKWPLSLILSRRCLTKYQLVFRQLFQCKHVERKLCATWVKMQFTREMRHHPALGLMFSLRQRMLHFLHNLDYYMTVEVLEPNWHTMHQRLQTVSTVDEVLAIHNDFLDTVLRACMLSNSHLFNAVQRIFSCCTLFAHFAENFLGGFSSELELSRASGSAGSSGKAPTRSAANRAIRAETLYKLLSTMASESTMLRNLHTFHNNFSKHLKDLLERLNENAHTVGADKFLSHLTTRLDFNSFYNRQGFYDSSPLASQSAASGPNLMSS